jgi:hypothetical protein
MEFICEELGPKFRDLLEMGSPELLHLLLLQVKGFIHVNTRFITQTPFLV